MDRIVGGVQVQYDLLRRLRMRLKKQVHQQRIHRRFVHHDLLVARGRIGVGRGKLQSVERALARDRLAKILRAAPAGTGWIRLARKQGKERIVPQTVVVVDVFVSQRQPVDPLGDQLRDAVLHPVRLPMIGEAGGQLPQDAGLALDLPQQQPSGVGRDLSAVETSHHVAVIQGVKFEAFLGTLCRHRSRLSVVDNSF